MKKKRETIIFIRVISSISSISGSLYLNVIHAATIAL
jgi:hypothetical protein